jgi:hypothetical protein
MRAAGFLNAAARVCIRPLLSTIKYLAIFVCTLRHKQLRPASEASPHFLLVYAGDVPGLRGVFLKPIVIPAKAGIHRQYEAWIPAFAGMTIGSETTLT